MSETCARCEPGPCTGECLQELPADPNAPKLKLHLIKKRGEFRLYGCRGRLKTCKVTEKAREKMGPCEDCVLADPNETVQQLYDRINRVN